MIELIKDLCAGNADSSSGGETINNQDITVIENGIYTAESPYTGLGTVTVDVPAGSGDEIEVLNLTGSTLAVGDKAWVSYGYIGETPLEKTATSAENNNCCAVVESDGSLVYFPYSGVVYNVANDTTTTVTRYTFLSTPCIKYTKAGVSIITDINNRYESTNYCAYGSGSLVGQVPPYLYVGDDYFYDYPNSKFIKMQANTLTPYIEIPSSLSISDGYTYGKLNNSSFCCYGNKLWYKKDGSASKLGCALIDDSNATVTDTGNDTTLDVAERMVPWVTKDGQFFIGVKTTATIITSYATGYCCCPVLYTSDANGVLSQVIDLSTIAPDLAPYYNQPAAQVAYNQQTDILTISFYNAATHTSCDFVSFKYANGVFTKIASYTYEFGREVSYVGIPTADGTGTILGCQARQVAGKIAVFSNPQPKAVAYKNSNIAVDSLTGFVTEGGDNGEIVKVATVMPEKINVNVTVNVDNAIITGGIE